MTKESETGGTSSSRIRMKLSLAVESIDFDPQTCLIRIKGKNQTENDWIKVHLFALSGLLRVICSFFRCCWLISFLPCQLGQYHTAELEPQYPFRVEKRCWDSLYLDRVKAACDPTKAAEIAAVVMQPGWAPAV